MGLLPTIIVTLSGPAQFVGGVDLCKFVLFKKQVNLVASVRFNYSYNHAQNSLHTNIYSIPMTCCLCPQNTYLPYIFMSFASWSILSHN